MGNSSEKLQLGNLTAVKVLHAFQWRALHAHRKTNCVTSFFEEAEEMAQNLDEKFTNTQTRPPLFGLPCSIKENLQVLCLFYSDTFPGHEIAIKAITSPRPCATS